MIRSTLQAAALALLAACSPSAPGDAEAEAETQADSGTTDAAPSFFVEAELVGLKGQGLRLRVGEEELEATSLADLSFATPLKPDDAYEVEIVDQPRWPTQTCTIEDAAGVIVDADVTVSVTCTHETPPGLDLGYGDAGVVILDDFSGFANSGDVPFDVALAPDGGVVIAGQALSTNEFDGVLWRLDGDGQPDLGFGDGGLVLHDELMFETFVAADVAADGSVYAVGRRFVPMAGSDLMIVHVLADGTLDPQFGDGGSVVYDNLLGGCPDQHVIDSALDHALTPEGLLISGTTIEPDCEGNDAFVARFDLASGALDPGYGIGGVFSGQGGVGDDTPNDSGTALALRPDGRVWMSGLNTADQGTDRESALLWRLESEGTLDPAFADAGLAVLSSADDSTHAWSVASALDGSAVVAGEAHRDATHLLVWRVLDAGGLDPAFADAGSLQVSNDDRHVSARRIALDSAERIVVVGTRNNLANDGDLAVWRFEPSGEPDASFADDGLFVWDGLGRDVGWGLAVDASDRIIVSASAVDEVDDVEMVVLRIDD